MASAINCKSFCNRLFKCAYFKERDTHAKGIEIIFNRVLREYKNHPDRFNKNSSIFSELVSSNLSTRNYLGIDFINNEDIKLFRRNCINAMTNLDRILKSENISILLDNYTYKNKIKGTIDARLDDRRLNLQLSYFNTQETEKNLDFYQINNYIYNQVVDKKHDCLVMSVTSDSYFLIKYNEIDFSFGRGFITTVMNNKMRRRGPHCSFCCEKCEHSLYKGIEKLRSII